MPTFAVQRRGALSRVIWGPHLHRARDRTAAMHDERPIGRFSWHSWAVTLSQKAPLDATASTGGEGSSESSTQAVVPPPLPITAFATTVSKSDGAPPPSMVDPTTALQTLDTLDKLAAANANVELASVEDVMDILSVVPPPLPPEAIQPVVVPIPKALDPEDALEALEWKTEGEADESASAEAKPLASAPPTAPTEASGAPTADVAKEGGEAKAATDDELTGAERRTKPRLKLDLEISLTSETHVFVGLTGDISTGGVFVPTYQLKPIGSLIDIEFTLPTGLVQAKGEVRWIREQSDYAPPGIGIAFLELPTEDRERIETFCRLRSPTYYDIETDG